MGAAGGRRRPGPDAPGHRGRHRHGGLGRHPAPDRERPRARQPRHPRDRQPLDLRPGTDGRAGRGDHQAARPDLGQPGPQGGRLPPADQRGLDVLPRRRRAPLDRGEPRVRSDAPLVHPDAMRGRAGRRHGRRGDDQGRREDRRRRRRPGPAHRSPGGGWVVRHRPGSPAARLGPRTSWHCSTRCSCSRGRTAGSSPLDVDRVLALGVPAYVRLSTGGPERHRGAGPRDRHRPAGRGARHRQPARRPVESPLRPARWLDRGAAAGVRGCRRDRAASRARDPRCSAAATWARSGRPSRG